VATVNALGDGEGVISDSNRNFHLFSVNLLQEVTFLFLHVTAILENIVVMLGNIVIALGGKMTIMGTLLGGLEVV